MFIGVIIFFEQNNLSVYHKIEHINHMQAAVNKFLLSIDDLHNNHMSRLRESWLTTHTDNTSNVLSWVGQHYKHDMHTIITNGIEAFMRMGVDKADTRFETDKIRIKKQLERILHETQQVPLTIDTLLEAMISGDTDVYHQSAYNIERISIRIEHLLQTTKDMAHASFFWQTEHTLYYLSQKNMLLWVTVMLCIALVCFTFIQPMQHLHTYIKQKLPTHNSKSWVFSKQENMLKNHLSLKYAEYIQLEQQLFDKQYEVQKSQQIIRRTEHELALLKIYNENLVNSLRTAIIVTDTTGAITGMNRMARNLFDMSETSIGSAITKHMLYETLLHNNPHIEQNLRHAMIESITQRFEALFYHSALIIDLTLVPYRDESGTVRGIVWVADNVTDAIYTKNQLLQAERLATIGRLSAQVAHEVRNPLSAIGLNAELLEDEFARDLKPERRAEALQLLHAIATEIEHLTQVTEAYLQLARLPKPSFGFVDINQLIIDLFTMLREEMKMYRIDVRLNLAIAAPIAYVDAGQIRQALLNIIRNSREAMLADGVLQVETCMQDHGGCRITMTDSGPGFSPSVLKRVFEAFYSTKPQGTGLGLSITQQIIVENHGKIDIRNQSPGATIVIDLPKPPAHVAYTS